MKDQLDASACRRSDTYSLLRLFVRDEAEVSERHQRREEARGLHYSLTRVFLPTSLLAAL